jgi:hypothetical protein
MAGRALVEQRHPTRASRRCEATLRSTPTLPILQRAGLAYMEQQRWNDAIENLLRRLGAREVGLPALQPARVFASQEPLSGGRRRVSRWNGDRVRAGAEIFYLHYNPASCISIRAASRRPRSSSGAPSS